MFILVGVDQSPGSALALRWASDVAAATASTVCAVRAWEYPAASGLPGAGSQPKPSEVDCVVLEELDAFVRETLGENPGVELRVAHGPADVALLGEARRWQASMIVVGRRGLGFVEGRLLGSVSRRLVEGAGCPVVVVSDGEHALRRGVILVGVDGSVHAERALEWAAQIATSVDAEVVAVHAYPAPSGEFAAAATAEAQERGAVIAADAGRRLGELGVRHRTVVAMGDPRSVMDEVIRAEDPALVVVGSRGAGPVTKLVFGSVAAYLTQHADRPVAIVRAAEARGA